MTDTKAPSPADAARRIVESLSSYTDHCTEREALIATAYLSELSRRERMEAVMASVASNEVAEAQEAMLIIQAALRHRQQPQDVTFHRGLKALRDAIDKLGVKP